ncbi:sensor histidine kinase [Bacteroidota bacterium]
MKKKRYLYFVLFWIGAFIVMFLSFLTILEPLHSLRNTAGFVIPLIFPVLILDYFFEKYFIVKKYIYFGISSLITILSFGLLNFYALKYLVQDREAESNTVLSIILFFLIYRGIKFIRIGTQQQFRLNQAELKLLKSQINPHFLFNNLNNIYSLIIEKNNHASDAVLKLSSLMRYMLESSKFSYITLKEEINFIEDYISLEEIRLEDNCEINLAINNEDTEKKLPPLLFIPLIENCFKHGISANKQNNKINIIIKSERNRIHFKTSNHIAPKRGIQLNKNEKHGINNLQKRLELLYPGNYSYKTEIIDNIYRVELILNI